MLAHVAPLGHIILIQSQPVFAHSPLCCVLSGEVTNTNFIVFCLTRSGSNQRSTALCHSLLFIYTLQTLRSYRRTWMNPPLFCNGGTGSAKVETNAYNINPNNNKNLGSVSVYVASLSNISMRIICLTYHRRYAFLFLFV